MVRKKKFYCGEYEADYGWSFNCHFFRRGECCKEDNFIELDEEDGGYEETWYSQGFYDSCETKNSKWVSKSLYIPHKKCSGKKALKRK